MDSTSATTTANTVNVNDCARDLTIFHEVRSDALFEEVTIGGSGFSDRLLMSVLGFGFSKPGGLSREDTARLSVSGQALSGLSTSPDSFRCFLANLPLICRGCFLSKF